MFFFLCVLHVFACFCHVFMIEAGGKLGPRPNPWRFVHFVLLSTNDHHTTSLCLGGKIVSIRSMVSDASLQSIPTRNNQNQPKNPKTTYHLLVIAFVMVKCWSSIHWVCFAIWWERQHCRLVATAMICNDFRKLYNHLSSTLVFETDTLLALLTICEFSHLEHQVSQ